MMGAKLAHLGVFQKCMFCNAFFQQNLKNKNPLISVNIADKIIIRVFNHMFSDMRNDMDILFLLSSVWIKLLIFSHLCLSYPCPGSIAMIAFLHASRFCASFGSSWCCLKSLRTQSIHLSLDLPRGLFPLTFIVVTCFATFVSSLLITWPYHERRFWVTHMVIGLTIASLLNFSFLIRSFLVLPWMLTEDATTAIVHALVTSRLDYCNAVLYGLPASVTNKMQRLQNTCARMNTKTRRRDHNIITPMLIKTSMASCAQTYRIHDSIAYISSDRKTSPAISLWHATVVPTSSCTAVAVDIDAHCTSFKNKDVRWPLLPESSSVLWNSLPANIRDTNSIAAFQRGLKTFYLGKSTSMPCKII